MQDVRRLNEAEQLELAESLRSAGVNLGSRSKLRLLADADAAADHGLDLTATGANAPPRQMQEDQPSNAEASKPDTYDHDCYYIAVAASPSKGAVGSRAGRAHTPRRVTAGNGWLL